MSTKFWLTMRRLTKVAYVIGVVLLVAGLLFSTVSQPVLASRPDCDANPTHPSCDKGQPENPGGGSPDCEADPSHPSCNAGSPVRELESPPADQIGPVDCEAHPEDLSCPCDPSGTCPTECGSEGGQVPDGNCGFTECLATDPCPLPRSCTPDGESCRNDGECCAGFVCRGNGKCGEPSPVCKDEGGPCGGNNVCCPGLICNTEPGVERDKCIAPPPCPLAGTCPTNCGYLGGTVPDGDCGTITCPAIVPPAAQECPTNCGYVGGQVPDGDCGTISCPAIVPPAAQECPTGCGYAGGQVPDGDCGTIPCPAIEIPALGTCPTNCGYLGGTVPDGDCGTISCPAIVTPAAQECPTACGYTGGQVPDGACGFTDCNPTELCPPTCVWSEWSACTADCGGGTQERDLLEGGAECGDLTSQSCNTDPCPVNCEWGDWSACSEPCGGGTQTREIEVEAQYGGAECEGPTEQACNTQSCPPGGGDDDDGDAGIPGTPGVPGTAFTVAIPVTGVEPLAQPPAAAGGEVLIPVTGVDLSQGVDFGAGFLHQLMTYLGLVFLGLAMVMHGAGKKYGGW